MIDRRVGCVTNHRKPRILSGAYDSQARYRDIRFAWQVHKRVHSYRSKCNGPPGLVEPHGHCTSCNSTPRTHLHTHDRQYALTIAKRVHTTTSMNSSLSLLAQERAYTRCFNYRLFISLSSRYKCPKLPREIDLYIYLGISYAPLEVRYVDIFTVWDERFQLIISPLNVTH